jgi:hypothetical protein
MNRVVWGMPTHEEMDNPKPLTEYAGCIIGPLTPKWHCEVCDNQVIPELNPKSGICLHEAPKEVRKGLNFVISRLDQFTGDGEDSHELIGIACPGAEPEVYSERDITNHKLHGDSLRIRICACLDFELYFDGFAISRTLDLDSPYHGQIKEREQETEFTFDPLKNLNSKLADLYFGSTILNDLVDLIGESVMNGCQNDFICEDSRNWKVIADFWVHQKELFPNFWLDRENASGHNPEQV